MHLILVFNLENKPVPSHKRVRGLPFTSRNENHSDDCKYYSIIGCFDD